jgi:hypothetical protein
MGEHIGLVGCAARIGSARVAAETVHAQAQACHVQGIATIQQLLLSEDGPFTLLLLLLLEQQAPCIHLQAHAQ